ncbi:MAG: hypothetical protein KAS30_01730 [Candidatus Diapherotrites archaeon]|nr:hypothetical protein [Candidatus Diapherotrites archaeon]
MAKNKEALTPIVVEETKEIKEAKESARGLCEQALSAEIATAEQYEATAETRTLLAQAKKKVQATFKLIIDPIKKAKTEVETARKEAVKLEETALQPFVIAEAHLKTIRLAWYNKQEEIRKEEERKELLKAERAAEKERKRLKDIADRARETAQKELEKGNTEKAKALIEKAEEKEEQQEEVYADPVAVDSTVSNNTKTSSGTTYIHTDLEVILPESPEDIIEACRAIVEGKLKTNVVQFSLNRLKQFGKAMELKGKHHGIVFKETKDERVR